MPGRQAVAACTGSRTPIGHDWLRQICRLLLRGDQGENRIASSRNAPGPQARCLIQLLPRRVDASACHAPCLVGYARCRSGRSHCLARVPARAD